jgi:hypothetical protein
MVSAPITSLSDGHLLIHLAGRSNEESLSRPSDHFLERLHWKHMKSFSGRSLSIMTKFVYSLRGYTRRIHG